MDKSLVDKFFGAASDLVTNLWALFTDADADWTQLSLFYDEVFYPYLIGGIIPGVIAGITAYYLSLPVIATYQKRRRAKLKKKLEELRAKGVAKPRSSQNT